LAGELPTREAERMIRELPNPLELWKKSRGAVPSARPGQPTPQSGGTVPYQQYFGAQ
jgi:hypothetical protein